MSLGQTQFRNHILGLGEAARAFTLEGVEVVRLNHRDPEVSFESGDDRYNGTLTLYPVTVDRGPNQREALRCE
jgi:hypothetical protein